MNHFLAERFQIKGKVTLVEPWGSGHINDTFKVCIDHSLQPSYILQRINTSVFPDVLKLMDNYQRVTNHLRLKKDERFQVVELVKTIDGRVWDNSDNGSAWRMLSYISDSRSFDLAPDAKFSYQAGLAYGWFVKSLSDLPQPRLHEVIPGFHSLRLRIEQLMKTITENRTNRLINCKPVVEFFLSRCDEMQKFDSLINTDIPLRTTHNDTKINNVLFSSQGKAISVVDLDTVMPGVIHYDFGDAIRTISSTACEDETDLGKVEINIELYRSFSKGFLSETRSMLTPTELHYLPKSPEIMAFIMGIRFLADYLRGDTYYKVKHPEHNIQRAQNQMALISDMEKKRELLFLE